ncbi:MAG: regulatory protein RecX [Edaphobacter sp.]|uniref:regulatory protein RecX n=1 Tax=Edaphobacter sp. TaxID=1934404 RepID=UPI0023930811|nr:regulatory protein RecX [Edaphobacter sp.]MDE1177986.1 regulatory protein RecX [Edaphobacter sp.]
MAFARAKKREPLNEAALFDYAVGALARKMRTVYDLKKLMKARAEEGAAGEAAMDRIIARLKELKYLSDTRFASDYARLRKENEKFGKRRVQQGLTQKGVQKELIASTLEKEYGDTDEVVLAREYVARKRMKKPEGVDAKKQAVRVMGRLQRAGFSAGTVFKVLREWDVEVDESVGEDDDAFAAADE